MKGSKLCYKLLQKLGGGEGVSVMLLRQFRKKFICRKLFFVLFNLKNPGIQVKSILATG